MLEFFLRRGSTYAADIDLQVWLILILTGFWFLVSAGAFAWLCYRYRAVPGGKAQYVTGEKHSEKIWIDVPHWLIIVCDVFIIVGAVQVWTKVKMDAPPADDKVRIVMQQWAWTVVHAGVDRQLDTADDIRLVDEMNLEVDKVYHYELTSLDVLHSFSVPVFRLKQDSIPGRTISGWFQPTIVGEFDMQCTEICGIGHGIMGARLRVHSPSQYATWLAKPTPTVAFTMAN